MVLVDRLSCISFSVIGESIVYIKTYSLFCCFPFRCRMSVWRSIYWFAQTLMGSTYVFYSLVTSWLLFLNLHQESLPFFYQVTVLREETDEKKDIRVPPATIERLSALKGKKAFVMVTSVLGKEVITSVREVYEDPSLWAWASGFFRRE